MGFQPAILLFCLIVSAFRTLADRITLQQGILEGTYGQSGNGTTFRVYYSVPYAKPPLGKLRFQAPEEPEPWKGVFNATVYPSSDAACLQKPDHTENTIIGTEDCLHLNVYAPAASKPGDDVPVIVFIFGGKMMFGTNTREDPHYLLDNRIVYVQPNFRVGFLGYLSTGDEVVSGNMGYKDQAMALKWTKKNIRAFGGDPNRITIYGHSSGSTSCMYHTFSPLSKGLFNRVIMQSGSAFAPYFLITPAKARETALRLTETLNCPSRSTSSEILDCLLEKNGSDIVRSQSRLALWEGVTDSLLGVVPEQQSARNVFMHELPITNNFESTEPEWLIGMTVSEIAQTATDYFDNDNEEGEDISNHYSLLLPIVGGYQFPTRPRSLNFMTRLLRTRYLGEEDISPATDIQSISLLSDISFTFPVTEAIKRYAGQRYVYKYNYRSGYSMQLNEHDYQHYLGVAHGDDLALMFRHVDVSPDLFSQQDKAMRQELITRYVNFAYSGNPNTPFEVDRISFDDWSPVTTERIEYLFIGQHGSVMETDYNKEVHHFLKSTPLFSNYF